MTRKSLWMTLFLFLCIHSHQICAAPPTLYLIDQTNHSIASVDLETTPPSVTKSISLENKPVHVAFMADGKRAYVLNENSNQISQINFEAETPTLANLIVVDFQPARLALTANGHTAYAIHKDSNQISQIDLLANPPQIVRTFAVEGDPSQIIISFDEKTASIVDHSLQHVSKIDLIANPPIVTQTFAIEGNPNDIAITADHQIAYAVNRTTQSIDQIDLTKDVPTFIRSFPLGFESDQLTLAMDGQAAFAFDHALNQLVKFDLTLNPPVIAQTFPLYSLTENQLIETLILTSSPSFNSPNEDLAKTLKEASNDSIDSLINNLSEAICTSTATSLSSDINLSVYGQTITLKATVTGTTPTGNVTFFDALTPLGTSTLNGAGEATLSINTLAFGPHNLTATYNGDLTNCSSTSDSYEQQVNPASTTTELISSSPLSVFGQNVTFTATVSAVLPGSGTPTGSVTFTIDGGSSTTVALNGLGVATFTTSSLSTLPLPHLIGASYGGSGNFNVSSTSLNQTVNKASTTTILASSNNPSVLGEAVTFTATVIANPPGAGIPTGNVDFAIDGGGAIPVSLNSAGMATFSTSTLSLGSHIINASYIGDTNYNPSSVNLTQTVTLDPTTTLLFSSLNPSIFGQSMTFTANVSATPPGSGIPTGTVTFTIDGIAQAPITLSGGFAAFTTSSLSAGSHNVIASYNGSATFNSSTSTTLVQVVKKATTATTLISNLNPSEFNQSVTFTAAVSADPGLGTPTGTVTFIIDGTPQSPVTLSGGVATLTTSSLNGGSHTIVASYSGNANLDTSTSPSLVQVVKQASTATTLMSSVNPSVFGQAVTFTATVTSVEGIPAGTVNFTVEGESASVLLVNGVATFTTSHISPGTHTVTTSYAGNINFASSNATLSQSVNSAATTLSIHSSSNPAFVDEPVIFTATVSGPAGGLVPNGTVAFSIDGKVIATETIVNGQASFTSTLALGTYQITAEYSGDSIFSPSTSSLTQFINNRVFAFVLPPANVVGLQKINRKHCKTHVVNVLTWNAPTGGNPPVKYIIYNDRNLTKLIGEVPKDQFKFRICPCKHKRVYTYFIISVDAFGERSDPVEVKVHARK